jgi:predicted amidohydrolase YtcJ
MLLTRQTLEGAPPGGWLPNERITIEQAIAGYTLEAAVAGRLERTEGSIEVGKVGDLIVLSRDILTAPPDELARTTVLMTVVGGKVVHDAR